MRKLLIAVAVLLVLVVGGLAVVLPGLVSSPAVKERIEQAARDATGREFTYTDLSAGLFPPRLRIHGPTLAGEAAGDPPFLEAREISLQVALWPLLARAVVLENLAVEEATLRLVRDADGLRLPSPPESEPSEPRAGGDPPATPAEEGGVSLAVQEVALRASRILLEDRTVAPAAQWDLSSLEASASLAPEGPTRLELDAKLQDGTLALDGTADLAAERADLEARLDGIGLATLRPYLDARRSVDGTLSGTVGVSGAFAAPDVAADLRVADGALRIGDVDLRGPLALRADLAGGERVSGTFDVDATEAALDAFEGAYRKPSGRPANVKGRIVPRDDGGFTVDDVELKIHNLDARGTIEVEDDGVRAALRAEPFSLEGWDALIPALAEYGARGTLRPGALELTTEPLSFRGRIDLDDVQLVLPEGGPEIAVAGAVEGTGDAVALKDVILTTGGEALRIAGRVAGLSREEMDYRLTLGAAGAETNTLLSAFTAADDQIFGPLELDTDLSGRTGDAALERLAGHVSFLVTPGQWKDVSLLEQTVRKLGTFGEAGLLVAGLKDPERAKKMERYYGDEFRELGGTFRVAQGWARTQDLRLVYEGYRVDLTGGLRLADRALDFAGVLTLESEVDENLAAAAAEAGEPAPEPRRRTIELAQVGGTLDEPDVALSSQTVRGLMGSYARSKVRRKYGDKLDEKLGEGASEQVGELLEGIFGGKR